MKEFLTERVFAPLMLVVLAIYTIFEPKLCKRIIQNHHDKERQKRDALDDELL